MSNDRLTQAKKNKARAAKKPKPTPPQRTTTPSSGLQQPVDDMAQLSAADLDNLQHTYGNRFIQRLAQNGRSGTAVQREEDGLDDRLEASRGQGQALPDNLQQQMGSKMGADFEQVRVHTGPEADRMNRSLKAKAFTTGSDIYFKQGNYDPHSQAGQKLIAHELTHVVQQGGTSRQQLQKKVDVNEPDDRFEKEAEKMAETTATQPPAATPPAPPADGSTDTPSAPAAANQSDSIAQETQEARAAVREGQEPQEVFDRAKQEKSAEVNTAAAQADTAKPAADKAEGDDKEQEGEKTEKKEQKEGEKKKEEKQAQAKTGKSALPDPTTIESLKYDPDAVAEPEMAEPLPTWNQLAYGTIQLQADLTEAEIAWRNNVLGGDVSAEGDQEETADFKAMLEGQFQSEAGLQDTGDGELLDRDAMLRDALVGGITAGVVQGATDWVADELVETATQKIPYADGWINLANIAADPAGWAADVEQKFSADAAKQAFGGWGDISQEKTPAGKAAFVFEKLLGIIGWAEGILGVFNQILQITIAILYLGWTIANAIPGGQAVAAVIMTVIKFLETINKFISAIVDFMIMFKPPLHLLAMICRAVDLKEIEGNPEEIRDRQAKLKGHAQSFSAGVTERGLKAAKGAIQDKYNKKKLDQEKQELRDQIANARAELDPDGKSKSKEQLRAEFQETYHESYETEAKVGSQAKQEADRAVLEQKQTKAKDKYEKIKDDPDVSYAAKREAQKDYQDSTRRLKYFTNPPSKFSKGVQHVLNITFDWNKERAYQNLIGAGTSAKDTVALASYAKNNEKIEKRRREHNQVTKEIAENKQDIDTTTQKQKEKENAIIKKTEEITTITDQQETLNNNVVLKQGKKKGLEESIAESKEQNQLKQANFEKNIESQRQEIAASQLKEKESNDRLKLTNQRVKADKIEIEQSKTKVAEQKIKVEQLSAEAAKEDGDKSKKETALKQAKQDLQKMQDGLAQQEKEAEQHTEAAKKAQVELDKAHQLVESQRKQLSEIEAAQVTHDQVYKQEQAELTANMQRIQQEMAALEKEQQEKGASLASLKKRKEELDKQQAELKVNLTNYQKSLEDLQVKEGTLQDLVKAEAAWQPSRKDVWSGGDALVTIGRKKPSWKQVWSGQHALITPGHKSDVFGAGGQRHSPGVIGASGKLTDFISNAAFGEKGLGEQFGNRLATAMMPGLGSVADWIKAYGNKDKLVAYKIDYQGGLPDTTADSVTEVKAEGGSTDEALKVVRQTDEEQVAEFVEGIDWAAKAPDHIKQNLAKDDEGVSSARKKEIYNQQAGDYLKQYTQTDAVTTAHTIGIDKENSAADQEFVVAKGAAPFSDLALKADPLSLKIKAEEGNQINTYQFEPTVVSVESEASDGVEVRSYALHYQGDERYQQDLAGGKAPAGQQMAKVAINSRVRQSPVQPLVTEQDLSKLSKADYDVNVKPAAAGVDPIPVAQPAKSLHLLAPQSDDGKNYKQPSIEVDQVNTTFAGEVSKGGDDPQRRTDLQGHLRPVDPADHKAKENVNIDSQEEKVDNEATPAYQQPIEYQPAVNSLADDEQLTGPLTIQRQLAEPAPADDLIVIQRQPDDEETAEPDTPPPPEFDAETSLDEIRAGKQEQMIQELPEPPTEAMQQVDASAYAYNAVRTEEYILKLQQQEIAAERQDAQSQQLEAQAAEQAALTNQAAVDQHQAEVAQKAQSQKEMEQAANEAQKPAGQAFSISGEISKLLQGILTPMIGALGVADKESGSGNQGGNANEVAKVGGQSHDTMGEGVQVAQSSAARAQQWQAETAAIQADATNQNKALADLGQEAGTQKEEAAEGADYLGEAQAHIDEQLDELDTEKDEQLFQHEEGVLESELWAEEHQEMRLSMFDQLEAELEAKEERQL